MAGHSKWKNIKHKKAASDEAKMKKFTKLSKEIALAAKHGTDIHCNSMLRSLIEKANEINMPKENYIKAIERAKASSNVDLYESTFYEGYGPGNVAFVVEVLSDNKNRAAAEVRRAFSHHGGRISTPGSVIWMFQKAGIIEGFGEGLIEEDLFSYIVDYHIYDFFCNEGCFYIASEVNDLLSIKLVLKKYGLVVEESNIGFHPNEKICLSEKDEEVCHHFIEKLEEVEDIQNIYYNA